MNQIEAQKLLDDAELLTSADEVTRAVARMAQEISAELKGEFPVVLAVMRLFYAF